MNQPAQDATLIKALLAARGGRGATQAELLAVSQWARTVNAETKEALALAKRPRLGKSDASADRQAAAQLNQHLLDSVIAGTFTIDVDEAGSLVFAGVVTE